MKLSLIVCLLLATVTSAAQAFQALDGYFIALDRCEAYQSKNSQTNPGDRFTEPMRAYVIRGINKVAGDFFQIIDTDAPVTEDRWVHVSCGLHVIEAGTEVKDTGGTGNEGGGGNGGGNVPEGEESADNLLALSWQPAFCEFRPNKTECIDLNNGNLPITEQQLSIHGLWAQPRDNSYCGVSSANIAIDRNGQWHLLPAPNLTAETLDSLNVAMPGTASLLERHEWIKHGTCHRGQGGAEEYFTDTMLLALAINDSVVSDFLKDHVGALVNTSDIREKFDEAFGIGAGRRVQFHCAGDQDRVLLQEITINLKGTIQNDSSVAALILAGEEASLGCPAGVIDAVGLQ